MNVKVRIEDMTSLSFQNENFEIVSDLCAQPTPEHFYNSVVDTPDESVCPVYLRVNIWCANFTSNRQQPFVPPKKNCVPENFLHCTLPANLRTFISCDLQRDAL